MGLMSSRPAYVTIHAHKSTDRTRLRVYAADDGSMPRVHISAVTTTGDLDIALTAAHAQAVAEQLLAAADACTDWYQPVPETYTGPTLAAVNGEQVTP